MKLKGGACTVAVCFASALFIITLFAQSKEGFQSQKVPQHDAAAIIKLVTIRVLDREGRPVTDLKKEDFVLYDNGKKKIITEFEVHTLGEEGMKVLPSGEAADLARSIEGMNRRLFIFLDIQGSDVNGMANAKQAALHFIDTQLRPGDEVGILGFSPLRGFLIQEYLTTDHERIRRAIEKTKDIEVKPSPGFISGGELDDSVRDRSEHSGTMRSGEGSGAAISVSGRADVIGSEGASIGVPGSSVFHRRDFVPRMFDLTQAMKYIRGNKSLIIFTARNLGPNASRLGKEFASASTPVYTVNTRNWIRQGVFTSIKKKHIWTEHPLQDLARESGGKYFADIKDVDTISREIQSLTGNFYVLGYYIDETWDGTYHQIKVEVAKPGLQVLAQHGYFNPRPYAELSDFQKQLHLFDLVFTDKNISAELLEIPIESLFIPGEEGANCVLLSQITVDEKTGVPPSKVEIYALLFDEDHKVVKERNGDVDFSSFAGEILLPYFLADLPSGKYECRLVTRDTETGQACVGKVAFGIPDMSEAEIVLSSPLLFAAGPESKIFKLSKKKGQKEKDENLSLNTIYRYLPENHSLVVREIGPEIENLLAVLPITFSGGPAPEVEFKVRLHPKPEGEAVMLPMEILDAKPISDNKDILMMGMSLPCLLPGEYDLEIEAIVKNTSASCSVHRSLVKR